MDPRHPYAKGLIPKVVLLEGGNFGRRDLIGRPQVIGSVAWKQTLGLVSFPSLFLPPVLPHAPIMMAAPL